THPRRLAGSRDRRRVAAAAPEGHDRGDGCRQPAAHHVEPFDGRGGDEASRHAGAGWHGQLARSRAHRHSGDLLLAPRARPAPRRGTPSGRDPYTPTGHQPGRLTHGGKEMRSISALILGALTLASAAEAAAADMKPIHTQKTKDVVVVLESEAG